MPDNTEIPKKSITPDWLVQGALTRVGDMLDKLTGRSWKPAGSLATSGLIERLKMLLDSEIKKDSDGRSFVPHNIKLKMQWDKFSTDSDDGLRKLENELLTAAVDHIGDNRYYTYAPLSIEAKADYFTEGVKLFVGFDKFDKEGGERELNVTIPAANVSHLIPGGASVATGTLSTTPAAEAAATPPIQEGSLVVRFNSGAGVIERRFEIEEGRRLSVGRNKDNDIAVDHTSVSKMHASLLLNSGGKLVIADTGSTNG
ncbi:MAG: FHA domain-containing protein, partial [Acidobacteriota bacterium]